MSDTTTASSPVTPTTPTATDENVFLVESVPRGFHSAVETLNILPESLIDEVAYKTLANIMNKQSNNLSTSVNVDELAQKLKFDLKFDLQQLLFKEQLLAQKMRTKLQRLQVTDEQDLIERSVGQEIQNVINCITYIYKSAIHNRVNSSNFVKCIRRQTQMSVNMIKILQQHYHNIVDNHSQQQQQTSFNLQRLKDLDWKLSVSMSSYCCEQLNDAKVTLIFTLNNNSVADNDNNTSTTKHSLELSLEEFKQFYTSFAEMANLITTL